MVAISESGRQKVGIPPRERAFGRPRGPAVGDVVAKRNRENSLYNTTSDMAESRRIALSKNLEEVASGHNLIPTLSEYGRVAHAMGATKLLQVEKPAGANQAEFLDFYMGVSDALRPKLPETLKVQSPITIDAEEIKPIAWIQKPGSQSQEEPIEWANTEDDEVIEARKSKNIKSMKAMQLFDMAAGEEDAVNERQFDREVYPTLFNRLKESNRMSPLEDAFEVNYEEVQDKFGTQLAAIEKDLQAKVQSLLVEEKKKSPRLTMLLLLPNYRATYMSQLESRIRQEESQQLLDQYGPLMDNIYDDQVHAMARDTNKRIASYQENKQSNIEDETIQLFKKAEEDEEELASVRHGQALYQIRKARQDYLNRHLSKDVRK
jgi:hypothetical protein